MDEEPTTYIDVSRPGSRAGCSREFADRARARGWGCRQLPVGHDAQVIDPDSLALLLDEIAAA